MTNFVLFARLNNKYISVQGIQTNSACVHLSLKIEIFKKDKNPKTFS